MQINNLMYEIAEDVLNMAEEPNHSVRKEYFRHKNTLLFHGDILNKELFNKQFNF